MEIAKLNHYFRALLRDSRRFSHHHCNMPTGALSENFTYVLCSCRPKLPFFGARAKAHCKKFDGSSAHVVLNKYHVCTCGKGTFSIPPTSTKEAITAFNNMHRACVKARKEADARQRAEKTYCPKVERERLSRFFADLTTSNYVEGHVKASNDRLTEAESQVTFFIRFDMCTVQ